MKLRPFPPPSPLHTRYDAVVCDPPYGLRAGARKTGSRRAAADVKAVDEGKRATHIPQTQPYAVEVMRLSSY